MKTVDLLDIVMAMGYGRDKALSAIDSCLDEVAGIENRKNINVEEIDNKLACNILNGFEQELDLKKFEAGLFYSVPVSPGPDPFECVGNTMCYVSFKQMNTDSVFRVKKKYGSFYDNGEITRYEYVEFDGYTLRAYFDED